MRTSSDKPYRVYRQPRRVRGDGSIPWDSDSRHSRVPLIRSPRRDTSRRIFKYARRLAYLAVVAAAVWGTIAFLAFREAVQQRNALVPKAVTRALAAPNGPALTSARNILLIGTDTRGARNDPGRADSMILLRIDVPKRRMAMLSIPRDLRVEIPGYGQEKINAAYQNGGPALAIRTLEDLTGVPINHMMLIDFAGFKTLIDDIGGITVDNPKRLRATKSHGNDFDGRSWFFGKGTIQLNGRRALAYARLRKSDDEGESDLSRGQRQQRVLEAIANKLASTESLLHPRERPHAAVQPLITDITAGEMVVFGFGRFWAKDDNVLRCRLGGDIGMAAGQSVIFGSEENRATIRMWLGDTPPLRPNLVANQYAPGCTRSTANTGG